MVPSDVIAGVVGLLAATIILEVSESQVVFSAAV